MNFQTCLITSTLLAGSGAIANPVQRPNIVFFLADDLGYMDIVAYASRVKGCDRSDCYYETPNIDRLVDNGVMFLQAYACPLCAPTRSSLVTGKYAARLGFMTATPEDYETYSNQGLKAPDGFYEQDGLENKVDRPFWPLTQGLSNVALPSSEITFAEALGEYTSAFIGKWHLGGHGSKGYSPKDQGFEEIAWFDSGSSTYFNWRNRWNQKKKVHPAMAQAELLQGNAGEETGEKYLTDDLAVQACRYIERQKISDKPFLLYFCQFAVHSPYQAKKEDIQYFSQKKTRGWNGQANPTYAAMLKSMDDSVGSVLQALEKTGQDKNTIIVFMSDNGGIVHPDENGKPTASNNAPLKGEKALLYEGGIRVPLFIWYPEKFKPAVCNVPVDCNDIYPTILQMAGESLAAYELYGDGKSLVPQLADTGNASGKYTRDTFFWHYPFYVSVGLKKDENTSPRSAIRKGDWKLILDWEGKMELYNIKDDISELEDCAVSQPERAEAMFRELTAWLNETVETRYIPKQNPKYDTASAESRAFKNIFKTYGMEWPSGCKSRAGSL